MFSVFFSLSEISDSCDKTGYDSINKYSPRLKTRYTTHNKTTNTLIPGTKLSPFFAHQNKNFCEENIDLYKLEASKLAYYCIIV